MHKRRKHPQAKRERKEKKKKCCEQDKVRKRENGIVNGASKLDPTNETKAKSPCGRITQTGVVEKAVNSRQRYKVQYLSLEAIQKQKNAGL